jgi:molecular chaperone GrpE (heat shock protein)
MKQSEQISEYEIAVASLKKSESLSNELHRNLLFKYAEAENKRRERLEEIKRRDAKYIQSFADKTLSIYGSLEKVCTLAQAKSQEDGSSEKVRSLAEGLVMTRDIMKNILSKHNVVSSK